MEYVEEDPCCICLEKLPKNVPKVLLFTWASCCANGYHDECVKKFKSSTCNLTNEQKSKCPQVR